MQTSFFQTCVDADSLENFAFQNLFAFQKVFENLLIWSAPISSSSLNPSERARHFSDSVVQKWSCQWHVWQPNHSRTQSHPSISTRGTLAREKCGFENTIWLLPTFLSNDFTNSTLGFFQQTTLVDLWLKREGKRKTRSTKFNESSTPRGYDHST